MPVPFHGDSNQHNLNRTKSHSVLLRRLDCKWVTRERERKKTFRNNKIQFRTASKRWIGMWILSSIFQISTVCKYMSTALMNRCCPSGWTALQHPSLTAHRNPRTSAVNQAAWDVVQPEMPPIYQTLRLAKFRSLLVGTKHDVSVMMHYLFPRLRSMLYCWDN